MKRFWLFIAFVVAFSFTDGAVGQFRSEGPVGASLGETATQRWQIGFVITATGQPVRNLVASQTVPMDWPEQTVKIVGEEIPPGVSVDYQAVRDAARQMVVKVPLLPAGATVRAVVRAKADEIPAQRAAARTHPHRQPVAVVAPFVVAATAAVAVPFNAIPATDAITQAVNTLPGAVRDNVFSTIRPTSALIILRPRDKRARTLSSLRSS